MKKINSTSKVLLALFALLGVQTTLFSHSAEAKINSVEMAQKTAENHIRKLLEPELEKYCQNSCKLMGIQVVIDLATPSQVAPGFDDLEIKQTSDLAPSSARIKLLIDDKIGPNSRTNLLEYLQQYLDTLEYPVKIDLQSTHFPLPEGSESRISELRERITKEFTGAIEQLIQHFCPNHCVMADYSLQTDLVNAEEAHYGTRGEFFQDGGTAIKIRDVSATILMDLSLTPEEQNNILEMAKLKTSMFKHVTIRSKALRFPNPVAIGPSRKLASQGAPIYLTDENSTNKNLTANSRTDSTSNTQSQKKDIQTTNETSESSKDTKSTEAVNSTNTSNTSASNVHQEKFERIEKIERVESGDAVQAELQKFKVYGLVFACSVLALLIFIALSRFRPVESTGSSGTIQRVFQNLVNDPTSNSNVQLKSTEGPATKEEKQNQLSKRYEIEVLMDELTSVYSQQPKVAKQVFTRFLTEEGVEQTAKCMHLFGESIVIDMLRDPSLQTDINELMEYYAKNTIDMTDEQKLDLLRKLHNRTIVGKLAVIGNRSSNLFDFLSDMDGQQIQELIRTESLTVKSIVLTQCDPQKRAVVYAQMDPEYRMQLLAELSRIDYLPRDYIFNVAAALKRKRKENPRLNTEALPGSEVLVSLLERTGQEMQKTVVRTLEVSNPESARTVKGKLVSIETLHYLRDGQLLEVILNLRHDELLQFLKGAPNEVRGVIFSKAPKDLVAELEEELGQIGLVSREIYQAIERKILNRMKIMANEGQINLLETNERMFANQGTASGFVPTNSPMRPKAVPQGASETKVEEAAEQTRLTSIGRIAKW